MNPYNEVGAYTLVNKKDRSVVVFRGSKMEFRARSEAVKWKKIIEKDILFDEVELVVNKLKLNQGNIITIKENIDNFKNGK